MSEARQFETSLDVERGIVEDLKRFRYNPLGYVRWAYPWGVAGGPLEKHDGPDVWQREYLIKLGEELKARRFTGGDPVPPVQIAVASGHGIGKSALVAWLVSWILDTRSNSRIIVTAGTTKQLTTRTFPEIVKWRKLNPFTLDWWADSISVAGMFIRHRDNPEGWCCDGQTSKKENSDSFQGLHAATSSPVVIMDEASAVPDEIDHVAQGALTDGEAMYLKFGNMTKPEGHFKDCFGRLKHRWITYRIDSRKAKMTNKTLIDKWIADYGEDSDFVRVRVKGEAPRVGVSNLIGSDVVAAARIASPQSNRTDPLVIGVDVARSGADTGGAETVFAFRCGRDARTMPWVTMRTRDAMQVAGKLLEVVNEMRTASHIVPSAIFIDGGGVGGPVVDRCRQLGLEVIEVNFGGNADEKTRYRDKGCEMWVRMRGWLTAGASIPDDAELDEQLTNRDYYFTDDQRMFLESKDDLDTSPDRADALALTFAYHVVPRDFALIAPRYDIASDYNPIERTEVA